MKYLIYLLLISQSIITSASENELSLEKNIEKLKIRTDKIQSESNEENTQKLQILIEGSKHNDQEISSIKDNIDILSKKIEERDLNYLFDLAIPFSLSIISALFFWLALYYFERKRKNNIRKNINRHFSSIRQELFHTFDTIMISSFNYNPPSPYQNKIKHEEFTIEDIKIGLLNKCFSLENITDKSIIHLLQPILGRLIQRFENIDNKIILCMTYYQELTSKEIDLLEDIREKIQTYDLKTLDQILTSAVTQDLSFMKSNFYDLYKLFLEIQKISLKNNAGNWNDIAYKASYLCKKGTYEECLNFIKKQKHFKDRLNSYKLRSLISLKKTNEAKNTLNEMLKNNNDTIGFRYCYEDIFDNEEYSEIFQKYTSSDNVEKAKNILLKEKKHNENFIESCLALERHYKRRHDDHAAFIASKKNNI